MTMSSHDPDERTFQELVDAGIMVPATRADLSPYAAQHCPWCAGNLVFQHYECWEEDERGNRITTGDLHDPDNTPRTEVWRCEDCDGDTAFDVEYPDETGEPSNDD